MLKTLVIIPAYNEQDSIVNVVNNIKKEMPNVDYVIINDCSTDETLAICECNHYNYISLPLNLGIGGGVQTGYKYAYTMGYDIAIQIDGDGQHDPKYIKDMVKCLETGQYDIVIGSRYIDKQGFQSTRARRLGIKFLNRLIKVCAGVDVKDVTSGYRAVNDKFVKYYAFSYAQDYPEPEAIVDAKMQGARIVEIPVEMKGREAGESSINLRRSIYYMVKVSLAICLKKVFSIKKG